MALRWWKDALSLMFRCSTPLALIALGATVLDLVVAWLRAALPEAEVGLVLLSSATAPLWLTALIVALRYADLGPQSLKISLPRLQAMCGRVYLAMPGILVAIGVVMIVPPQRLPLWQFSSVSWTLLALVGLLSWNNLVSACLLVGYHDKPSRDARALATMGWKISGMVSLMTTMTIGLLAWSGAASSVPSPGSVFSSTFLAVILLAVLYVSYVDIFEQRKLGQPGRDLHS